VIAISILFAAVVSQEEKHYVALAPDVDVSSQGKTIEHALSNLKEALELYFEDEDAIANNNQVCDFLNLERKRRRGSWKIQLNQVCVRLVFIFSSC
jgi:predicted RNase H-like HicB family nuclease